MATVAEKTNTTAVAHSTAASDHQVKGPKTTSTSTSNNATKEDDDDDSIYAATVSQWVSAVYHEKLPEDISSFRHLLETWAGIPAEEVDDHLYRIRDKAFAIQKYPCISRWSFTNLHKTRSPEFQSVIARLLRPNSQDALLDVACCLGQILRQLACRERVPTEKLYGTDLLQEFLDVGFELFRDEGKWPAGHFTAIDLLSREEEAKEKLRGKVTMIHAANVFHLFDWADQISIAVRMLDFLKPGVRDPVIFGVQIGKRDPGRKTTVMGRTLFLHDPKTLQKMWDEVGEATGMRWRVDAAFLDRKVEGLPSFSDDCWYLRWAVYSRDDGKGSELEDTKDE